MAEPSLARLSALFFGFLLLLATYSWVPVLHSGFLSGTGVRKTLGPDPKPRVDHSSAKPHHPLDPLTVREIERVRTILLGHDPRFGSGSATIHSMALDEPDKTRVVQWKKGNRLPSRRAEVLALSGGQSHVIVVDLDSGRVLSDVVNPTSGYPILTMDDLTVASQMIFKLHAVYGEWLLRDFRWDFVVDDLKGARLFLLNEDSTHAELVAMAQEDYNLDMRSVTVEISYSLPAEMMMTPSSPPIHVTSDRQVRNLLEILKTHRVCLCVSSRSKVETVSEKREEAGDNDEAGEWEEDVGDNDEAGEWEEDVGDNDEADECFEDVGDNESVEDENQDGEEENGEEENGEEDADNTI